ncbi:hypothetical protein KY5_7251c [Streptomyces formicae]|uniref:Uncharacterized protein n=2 Tax=Streptomyces formicae TaxID=1616117 RepID=A0A291QKN5_9ACTN|nr:hypothetical protein KY5_7251c [Streptomyces formicae]
MHWPPRTDQYLVVLQLGAATALFIWLPWVVIGRTTLTFDKVSPGQRLLKCGAAVGCGTLTLCAAVPAFSADRLGQAVFGCSAAWLAIEVSRSNGIVLERPSCSPDRRQRRRETWSITESVLAACAMGAALTFVLLQILLRLDVGALPVMEGGQLSTLGLGGIGDLLAMVVWTVAIEDVVIVAAVAALLTAARRPAWQIYTTICVVEVLLHAYFGLPAIGMALYAARRVWLYRRYQRLLPLVVGHALFDLLGGLLMPLPLSYRVLVVVSLLIVVHLMERRVMAVADEPERIGEAVPVADPEKEISCDR